MNRASAEMRFLIEKVRFLFSRPPPFRGAARAIRMCLHMENYCRGNAAVRQIPDDPTIRFTIDPSLLRKTRSPHSLEDTLAGRPLLLERAPKRSVPKWVGIAAVGAAAVVALWLGALWVTADSASPAAVSETFLAAMEQQDYSALSAVAVGSGVTLDEESVAPMFALYRKNTAFRDSVTHALAEGTSDGLFVVRQEQRFPVARYRVQVAGSTLSVHSNLSGAQITVNGRTLTADGDGKAVLTNLLPGDYTVRAVYESQYGDSLQTETPVSITGAQESCELNFQYTSLGIYNDFVQPVQIFVGGASYAAMEPKENLVLSPIAPDTEVTAQVTSANAEVRELSTLADEGYFYIAFPMCRLEVYNEYEFPMQIARGGEILAEIPAGEMRVLQEMPSGETLTMTLQGVQGLAPLAHQVDYDYEYLYPSFVLDETQRAQAERAVLDAVAQDSALAQQIWAAAGVSQACEITEAYPTVCEDLAAAPNGDLRMTVQFLLRFAAQDDTTGESTASLPMLRTGGQWRVQGM